MARKSLEPGRRRHKPGGLKVKNARPDFVNPYPWMSEPEAMVKLELEARHIPFSWRYFDGDAPTFSENMDSFHPEFTLSEYRLVIMVLGGFFGNLPGVLDTTALAHALLEEDGWKVKVWHEVDIRAGVSALMSRELPELINPAYRGGEKIGPYGRPDLLAERRSQLRSQGLERKQFFIRDKEEVTDGRSVTGRRIRRRGRKPRFRSRRQANG